MGVAKNCVIPVPPAGRQLQKRLLLAAKFFLESERLHFMLAADPLRRSARLAQW